MIVLTIIETPSTYLWSRKSQRAEDGEVKDDGAKRDHPKRNSAMLKYPAAPTYVTRLSCYFYISFANSITRGRRGSPPIPLCSSVSIDTMERTTSTPSSPASQDTTKINSDGQGGQFAFLVHSQDSVSQNTPPDVDDQRLTRQRRRRTRYDPHNIRHEDRCLLIALAAPRIMPFSKPNTRRIPNLTKPQESRL